MSFPETTAFLLFAGLLGAGVAIPASRKLMLGSVEQDWLAGELEFDRIGDDGSIVHLKSGEVFQVWALEGTAYETKLEHLQTDLCLSRSNLIANLARNETTLRFIGVKRQKDLSFEASWPSITLEEIGAAEQQNIRQSYETRWFVIQQAKTTQKLLKMQREIRPVFQDYKGRLLSTPEDNQTACELTGFLNYLVCGELRDDLPHKTVSLSGSLPAADLTFEDNGLLRTFTPKERYHRTIAIREWPEVLIGEMIGEIMALNCDLEIFQINRDMKRLSTLGYLNLKENQNGLPFFGNAEAAAAFRMTAEDITADRITLSETQFQITLRTETEEQLNKHIEDLTDILSRRHVVWSLETTRSVAALWFNRMPGHDKLVRPLYLANHNVAALWPFQYSPKGLEKSAVCDKPVRLLKTPAGGSYSFQFQCSDKPQAPGNFLVFAKTGSGKTTLIMHLLSGLAKNPNFKSYIFDSNEGTKFMIEAFGGLYQSYEDLAFNPLDVAKDSLISRSTILQTIRSMVGSSYCDAMEEEISHVIDNALSIPPDLRTFNAIHSTGFEKGTDFEKAFAKWIRTNEGRIGEYAHIFNAPQDCLKDFLGKSFMTGINMNEALSDENLGPPVVFHITNAIVSMARAMSNPFAIFIDEAANLLRNDSFREDFATIMYREIRKMDGIVGMAFQDPSALSAFDKQAEAIIQNTSNLFFFPSSGYSREGLKPFGLNDEQMDFVTNKNPVPGQRRVLVIKRNEANGTEEAAIVNIDLSDLGEALRFYRSGIEANRMLEEIKAREGEQWLNAL